MGQRESINIQGLLGATAPFFPTVEQLVLRNVQFFPDVDLRLLRDVPSNVDSLEYLRALFPKLRNYIGYATSRGNI
jgi:hypothetical protein